VPTRTFAHPDKSPHGRYISLCIGLYNRPSLYFFALGALNSLVDRPITTGFLGRAAKLSVNRSINFSSHLWDEKFMGLAWGGYLFCLGWANVLSGHMWGHPSSSACQSTTLVVGHFIIRDVNLISNLSTCSLHASWQASVSATSSHENEIQSLILIPN